MEPVVLMLAIRPEIDYERDAVVHERLPAHLAQTGQPVGTHDDAVGRLAAPG
jgi:hypothetical protein